MTPKKSSVIHILHLWLLQMETEKEKYKQWDGRVGEYYLPETLACCQLRNIHLCCRAQLMTKTRERGRERGREGERERRACV